MCKKRKEKRNKEKLDEKRNKERKYIWCICK